jgi:hypothetical protein
MIVRNGYEKTDIKQHSEPRRIETTDIHIALLEK